MEKIIEDIDSEHSLIEECLTKYGYSAEHNLFHFKSLAKPNWKNFFFMYGDFGVMAQFNRKINVFKMVSEIIAPPEKREELFLKFLSQCLFEKKAKKVVVELEEKFRKKIMPALELNGFRALSVNYALLWPLFNMSSFDENLSGKQFKKLRNIWNRYKGDVRIKIANAKEVQANDLKELVLKWARQRNGSDRTEYKYFINQVENGFKGCDSSRVVLSEGKPISITAGWRIPNSKNYYSAIGIYDYEFSDIGEFSNIDDLIQLKRMGYEWVDFGGSDKKLLEFKKKFGFFETYKTYVFSIVRKEK